MNRLSKIFLFVIIILSMALIFMVFSYYNMRKVAQNNLYKYLNSQNMITLLIRDYPELQNVDFKALEKEANKYGH